MITTINSEAKQAGMKLAILVEMSSDSPGTMHAIVMTDFDMAKAWVHGVIQHARDADALWCPAPQQLVLQTSMAQYLGDGHRIKIWTRNEDNAILLLREIEVLK